MNTSKNRGEVVVTGNLGQATPGELAIILKGLYPRNILHFGELRITAGVDNPATIHASKVYYVRGRGDTKTKTLGFLGAFASLCEEAAIQQVGLTNWVRWENA
jgi:hypothetical protein